MPMHNDILFMQLNIGVISGGASSLYPVLLILPKLLKLQHIKTASSPDMAGLQCIIGKQV